MGWNPSFSWTRNQRISHLYILATRVPIVYLLNQFNIKKFWCWICQIQAIMNYLVPNRNSDCKKEFLGCYVKSRRLLFFIDSGGRDDVRLINSFNQFKHEDDSKTNHYYQRATSSTDRPVLWCCPVSQELRVTEQIKLSDLILHFGAKIFAHLKSNFIRVNRKIDYP
jgi:hypothetical protein